MKIWGFKIRVEKKIKEKLKEVIDPELGADVVNLGFIYDIEVEDKTARIKMTFTSPGCPMRNVVENEVQKKAEELEEIKEARVNVVFEPQWTPDKMSEKAKKQLGFKWKK